MNPLYRNDRAGKFLKSWYAATTDIPNERPPLYGHIEADVCVIGAGFTGLTAALNLAQKGVFRRRSRCTSRRLWCLWSQWWAGWIGL